MRCERCGHQMDDADLFCARCGKAVFEEYMDEDDIWEHYKPDSAFQKENNDNPEVEATENVYAEKAEEIEETAEIEKAEEAKTEEKKTEEELGTEQGEKGPESPDTESESEEENLFDWEEGFDGKDHEKSGRRKEKNGKNSGNRESEGKNGKKSPALLISLCVLMTCLLLGIMWGVHTVQEMDKEKDAYYAAVEKTQKLSEEQKAEETSKDETDKASQEVETEDTDKKKEEEKKEPEKEEAKKEETKKEKKKEEKKEYFVSVDKDSVDFSQFSRVSVTTADQNSMASSDSYDYSAWSATDGDISSSWQEGQDGVGEGTGIRLDFDGKHKVRYMVLYLGNWRSDNLWAANARPAVLTISVGGVEKDVEFSDEMKPFCLSFDAPVEASSVSLFIKSGYEGDRWNDNCISEVEIYE